MRYNVNNPRCQPGVAEKHMTSSPAGA